MGTKAKRPDFEAEIGHRFRLYKSLAAPSVKKLTICCASSLDERETFRFREAAPEFAPKRVRPKSLVICINTGEKQ